MTSDVKARCEQIKTQMSLQPLTMIKKNYKKDLQSYLVELLSLTLVDQPKLKLKNVKIGFTDAPNATRAAVEEGIVPGGETALLYSIKALDGGKGAAYLPKSQVLTL